MYKLTKIKTFLIGHFPFIGITIVWLVLLITNYTPGTYLLGWDNLQTELNPGLAVKRAFFSSWQEYQSFGLPAGMGHAADLLRSIVLYLASFIVPQNLIRYGFQMAMVLVGALGALRLLEFSGLSKDKRGFALLGALFYILNYNIIQMMFLPYESFTIFMGMLPWEIWAFLNLLQKDSSRKKAWLTFVAVFLLATPQSQALQLFVVLMLSLALITLGTAIGRKPLLVFKRALLAALVIFLINSFWILPQFYFLKTGADVVQTAKINQLSTQDVFYRNKDKGNLKDFLTYTGFFNDGIDSNQQPIFATWKDYRGNMAITILMYTLTGISLVGIFTRSKYRTGFTFLYILILVSLLNNVFPLDILNELVRKNSFINQVFRSPFTKFSILYALISSYFFAYGAYFITRNINKLLLLPKNFSETKLPQSILMHGKYLAVAVFAGLILTQSLPAFTGNYVSPEVRVQIPKSYFDLFKYFNSVDKNKRIALLPEYTHWGWIFNNWGYDGSGFIWYGIEQPIISRNFDMWSTKSEGYYWEIKNALEKEDVQDVERVLEKYGVDYLILDRSVSPVVASSKAIQDTRVNELLQKSSRIKLEKNWDFLTVYKFTHDKKIQDFVWVSDQLPNIGPAIDLTNSDTAYAQQGNYQSNQAKNYDIFYPFLDLTTQTKPANPNWEMKETDSNWIFTGKLPGNLNLPENSGESQIVLYHENEAVVFTVPYKISTETNTINVIFPKIQVSSFQLENASLRYCVNRKGDIPSSQGSKTLRIEASSGDYICANYDDLNLDQKYGYIVKIENKNTDGQRLFFYALDKTKDQPYIEDRLSNDTQYYVLGNKYAQGIGYSFAFQANSYKTIPSVNEITGLSVYLMPYDVLKGLAVKMSSGEIKKGKTSNGFEAKKLAYHKYIVDLKDTSNKTIVLNQAYQEGWKAYAISNFKCLHSASSGQAISNFKCKLVQAFPFFFGKEIKEHVTVNNWANGWVIQNQKSNIKDQKIVVVYLPQYLEYIGFGMLIITFAFIVFTHKRAGKTATPHPTIKKA